MPFSRALFALSALNTTTIVAAALIDPGLFGVLTCPIVLIAALICSVSGLPVLAPAP